MAKKATSYDVYEKPITSDFEKHTEKINGIIEDVDTGIKHTFHNKEELWMFITEYKKY